MPPNLPKPASAQEAADSEITTYGLSVFGDLAQPADFTHFPYVNVNAPKGGQITVQPATIVGNQGYSTFNTLNAYILRGDGAAGMGLIFDSLMSGSGDEPDSLYGLVAHTVKISADKQDYRFLLRKEARFHDGSPLTAHDVAFSLNILKEKGHPVFRQSLRDLVSAEAEADDIVHVRLNPNHSREAPIQVAGQPIFSAAFYAKTPFDETTMVSPLGSSIYKVGAFEQGRYIVFDRVPDYWGVDLPVNRGQANFAHIRFEYFSDRKVAFEAFKAGIFTYHEEATAAVWATGYDFDAVKEGRVKRESFPDNTPATIYGWCFNLRRDKFKDIRIREALGLGFDFKWTNANIMYGDYARNSSYFERTPMAAEGLPSAEELALLEPFREKLNPTVFGEAYVPPESDGSGQDRALLRRAGELLSAAGCKRRGTVLLLPDGKPFEIEFLNLTSALEPHTAPFIKNLKLLGIDASYRTVDSAQYKRRLDEFDFDIVVTNIMDTLTPGEGMRFLFGSESANLPGSYNYWGVKDPVIDALIEKAIVAPSRADLTIICRAIDRIMRAGRYWVPMWHSPVRRIAYWDLFSRPERSPKYDISAVSTWWYDEEKAKRIHFGNR